jgi:hypothetical protein
MGSIGAKMAREPRRGARDRGNPVYVSTVPHSGGLQSGTPRTAVIRAMGLEVRQHAIRPRVAGGVAPVAAAPAVDAPEARRPLAAAARPAAPPRGPLEAVAPRERAANGGGRARGAAEEREEPPPARDNGGRAPVPELAAAQERVRSLATAVPSRVYACIVWLKLRLGNTHTAVRTTVRVRPC